MINTIRLQHFRTYDDRSFEFKSGVTIIVGPNGSGKTNLLEAVLVLARGSSYRAKDGELISFDKPWTRLDAETDEGLRVIKIVSEPQSGKTYEINEKVFKRLTLQHSLPVVLFEPNDLRLLHGSPDGRRTYLDDLLEQTIPHYGGWRRNYRRLLAQRNALLKRAHRPSNAELFPWNLRLSELGAAIARQRVELCTTMDAQLGEGYRAISKTSTKIDLHYLPKFQPESYESHMLNKLEIDLPTDIFRGFTAAGPHREDFVVTFDGHRANETASRGEVRTLVLALKVIELNILQKSRGVLPLLLLDDVFSELDASRRQALAQYLQQYQTFITTTDADIITEQFVDSKIIRLG